MKSRLLVIILTNTLLNSGCQYSSQIGPFSVERPVMLGKIQNIGGTMIKPSKQKDSFGISNYHGHTGWGVIGVSGAIEYDISDRSDKTEELKKIILNSDDLIKINNVYFKSTFVIVPITLILYMDFRSTTGVQGDVYENNRSKE